MTQAGSNITHYGYDNGLSLSVTEYVEGDVIADCLHYHELPNIYFILQGGSVEKCQRQKTEFYHTGEPHQNIRKLFPCKSINWKDQ